MKRAIVFGMLMISSGTAALALGRGGTATAPATRAADAPPLVAVTKERDGNFRIAPPYVADPAFTVVNAGVPQGKVVRFTMSSDESKIYPTVAGRGGRGAATGPATTPATTQALVPFQRPVALYTPPGYVAGTEVPFIIVMDGTSVYSNDQQNSPYIPRMLDNLINQKRVPAMAAILINPGQNRSLEYDTVSDRYLQFIETEVLPKITKEYGVNFTKDPEGRAVMGESSGSACALSMAWFHPELYRRVISYSGTFVALRTDPVLAPNGAWEYHQNFIPKSEPKPLRIWLHVSENDNGSTTPEAGMRNWVIANIKMAEVLKAKGYHYQFVFSEGVGHVPRNVERQTLPEAFEWTWMGYKGK